MKGTEGIDYVITECSHCKGSGKCACYDCLCDSAIDAVKDEDGDYNVGSRDVKIVYLKEEGFEVTCKVCKGVGKVVFWRE